MKRLAPLIFLLLLAPNVLACSVCVRQPLKFAFQDSKVFFLGTVADRSPGKVTFQVREQFAGAPTNQVTLATYSSCSVSEFLSGVSYLVEATDDGEGGLYAYLCSHTQVVHGENPELQLVRRRANWWKSRLSRISWYRFKYFIGRHFAG
jgi:hypothetical protein